VRQARDVQDKNNPTARTTVAMLARSNAVNLHLAARRQR
jgi:hypothetical protein